MSEETQLSPTNRALAINNLDDIDRVATTIASSGMFGITKKEQAATLMMICIAEGRHPIAALRRYHIIENRPSMRADAMQGDFQASGAGIIWHARTDAMVAATFFASAEDIDGPAQKRAAERFKLMWKLSFAKPEDKEYSGLVDKIADLSQHGEETIIRTYADAEAKGLTAGKYGVKDNWRSSPRQMLTARCITEGVRLIAPGIIAGIAEEGEARDLAEETHTATAIKDTNPYANRTLSDLESERDAAIRDNRVPPAPLLGAISELKCAAGDAKPAPVAEKSAPDTKKEEKAPETAPASPKKAKEKKPTQPELPAQPEPEPIETTVVEESPTAGAPEEKKINPYEVVFVELKTKGFLGEKLGNLSPEMVKTAYVKWVTNPQWQTSINSNPGKIAEAAAITSVYKDLVKSGLIKE